jgi:tetrathionate reductase subunit B
VATELDNIELEPARRQFLKGAAALATTLLAPGILLYQTGQASSSTALQPRWGLLIDTNALSEADVDACVSACQREHGWKAEPNSPTDAQWIRKVKLTDPATGYQNFLPMMCQHCAEPPCVDVCPTGASFKRADGIVLVNMHSCIGCRLWMIACTY